MTIEQLWLTNQRINGQMLYRISQSKSITWCSKIVKTDRYAMINPVRSEKPVLTQIRFATLSLNVETVDSITQN